MRTKTACQRGVFAAVVLSFAVSWLSGCGGGGGGGGGESTPPTFTVGGGLSGLSGTAVLGLSIGGGSANRLSVTSNGAFNFAQTLTSGQSYAVTVQTHPAGQTCTVGNASGAIGSANVTNVSVVCADTPFAVGGSVSGLNGSVVLGLSIAGVSAGSLNVSADGGFSFSEKATSGKSFLVTIQTQPLGQSCTVTNGSGVVGLADVTDVAVACTAATFSVGGSVSGLSGTLVLAINAGGAGGTPLTLATNGSFAFSQLVASGLNYAVSVQSQPAGQGCSVSNASGVIGSANVTDISVTCTNAPPAPSITASPGNGQAALAWAAVPGATSYNVYTSLTSPVTAANPRISVATANATVSGLANGVPVYAAVTAVNAGGESPLSNEACAVPTGAATTGLTLYDALCAGTLDAARWTSPLFSRGVVDGAMVLSTQASNMEPYARRGLVYGTFGFINPHGQRVSALQAKVTVPASSAARTAAAELRAGLRLAYQPPAARLAFPSANLDLLTVHVGLRDDGNGLRAFREVRHCDNANCTAISSAGIDFTDPAGFAGDAPASYGATYLMTVTLDETTGVFTWAISGGGLDLSGAANPAAYVAGNTNWMALGANPLPGNALNAAVRTRIIDNAGGGSGRIAAQFDDVKLSFNNNPALALWDDFSGVGGNSGPTELSAFLWTNNPGMNSTTLTPGSLAGHAQATTNSAPLSIFHQVLFGDPTTINTIQADFTVSQCSNTQSSTNRVGIGANVYNDGTPGTTPPDINQPGSRVGDINASLFIDCTAGDVRFQVTRFDTNAGAQTLLSNSMNSSVPKGPASVVGNAHTLRLKWDPTARLLTFQADGETAVVVDPTTINPRMSVAAPYAKPPTVPDKSLSWFFFLPSSSGETATVDFKVNNVFTAP
jgi:hypothetical protein